MPIIAESEPIRLDVSASPTPTSPTPASQSQIVAPGNVLERHRQFIRKIDASSACFNKGAITGFSDTEFTLHLGIAKIDKYIADAGNGMFCSEKAVNNLSKALERQTV